MTQLQITLRQLRLSGLMQTLDVRTAGSPRRPPRPRAIKTCSEMES